MSDTEAVNLVLSLCQPAAILADVYFDSVPTPLVRYTTYISAYVFPRYLVKLHAAYR